jgi:hypothetical protein
MTNPPDGSPAERPALAAFPGGKLPAQPARPQLRASRFLDSRTLPAPPESVDWLRPIPSWPMYGNDRLGDCVLAGIGHHEQQISLLGQGIEVRVSLADVIGGYSAVTGYDPDDPSTDQGTYVQDAMSWWRKTGIAGHQIIAYASIDPADLTLVKQCINLFGAVGIGFNFPASAMSQFNRGEPWQVVTGAPIEGGHYVMTGAYDPNYLDSITWAARQRMTPAFWRKYVDEVWVVIDDEMVSKLSQLSRGADLAAFAADFTGLTGETVPLPEPVDPPTPVSVPDLASPADRLLRRNIEEYATHTGWFGKDRRQDLRDWIASKDW